MRVIKSDMCQLFFPNFCVTINLNKFSKRFNIGLVMDCNGKDLVPLLSVIEGYSRLNCKMTSALSICCYLNLAILIERSCEQKLYNLRISESLF